jgi:hypothetical protein
MQRIAIAAPYKNFRLTKEMFDRYNFLSKKAIAFGDEYLISRDDPFLIQTIEEFDNPLVVVEIPDGVLWEICDFEGLERVEEVRW